MTSCSSMRGSLLDECAQVTSRLLFPDQDGMGPSSWSVGCEDVPLCWQPTNPIRIYILAQRMQTMQVAQAEADKPTMSSTTRTALR